MMIHREIGTALNLGLLSNLARPRHLLLTVAGFLIASVTLVVLLTVPAGLDRLAGSTGRADVAIVLPGSMLDESANTLSPEQAKLAASLPGIARDELGQPLAAPQFVVHAKLRRLDGSSGTVLARGVTSTFWNIAGDAIHVSTGRRFKSGINELIAGHGVARSFTALDTGAQLQLNRSPWRVSGEFSAGGGLWESELWTDLGALQAAYNAQGQITSLWVKLDSPGAYAHYAAALQADPRLHGLRVIAQRDYYALQVSFLSRFVRIAATAIATVLGLGAVLAIANALGMALAARRREIAVLRAVGYCRCSLAVALLIEVLAVGLLCAGVALLLGWLLLNGRGIDSSTANQAIRFSMDVTSAVAGWTLAYVLVLGTTSALWPVWRVVHAPLVHALRDE